MTEMTDIELLKAAAKAAGITIRKEMSNGWFDVGPMNDYWNPLRDDGDALRLAVRLGMNINVYRSGAEADCDTLASYCGEDAIDGDVCAATRRAIVRAAAAMSPK